MTTETKYTIGQTLWFVPSDARWNREREVTITKVGNKWLTLSDRQRANIDTLMVDGGNYSSPGRCYVSKNVHDEIVALNEAWREFTKHFEKYRWNKPAGITIEKIAEAERLLFGEEPTTE